MQILPIKRWGTHRVGVGEIGIGDTEPIQVQSMTNTDTMDTGATVAQSIRLIEAGCALVRITAPSVRAAAALGEIRSELRRMGKTAPLAADIHFLPEAAGEAARHVEKVRINPGNYADRKKNVVREYTEDEYAEEIVRIERRFLPLVRQCREAGVAMRVGTNHGSLSDRIMNRYGDTPLGMVESAFEFLRVCERMAYRDVVLSMKASSTKVMVGAYRMLHDRLRREGWTYPLHLGVTEAGDGRDGRVKSAVGIGSLLMEGLGDTIRVSLTEDPVYEIPVAQKLLEVCAGVGLLPGAGLPGVGAYGISERTGYQHRRRPCREVMWQGVRVGGGQVPRVVVPADADGIDTFRRLRGGDTPVDFILDGSTGSDRGVEIDGTRALSLVDLRDWERTSSTRYPVVVRVGVEELSGLDARLCGVAGMGNRPVMFMLEGSEVYEPALVSGHTVLAAALDRAAERLDCASWPIMVSDTWCAGWGDVELGVLGASARIGKLLLDGIGDAVWVRNPVFRAEEAVVLGYDILQAVGLRVSKAEYVACPSCGRTMFNLEETTARIRQRTKHLKGVKIAVMGCIVNGPGEMADADFGYVGSGPGRVQLFVGKECVERAVPEERADDLLIELIRAHGKWVDPSTRSPSGA